MFPWNIKYWILESNKSIREGNMGLDLLHQVSSKLKLHFGTLSRSNMCHIYRERESQTIRKKMNYEIKYSFSFQRITFHTLPGSQRLTWPRLQTFPHSRQSRLTTECFRFVHSFKNLKTKSQNPKLLQLLNTGNTV